jgi:hypothetical protein
VGKNRRGEEPPLGGSCLLVHYAHENEVRDAKDNLPTVVMEFVAETVNTHYLTM